MLCQAKNHPRKEATYKNESEKYILPSSKKQFNRQYAHIYAARLWSMRNVIETNLLAKKKGFEVCRLSDLKPDVTCHVIGTLFKSQRLKPSVLKELGDELSLTPQPIRDKYVDEETDELYLEDELQRIVLVGLDVGTLPTGLVVSVFGKQSASDPGKFLVTPPLGTYPYPQQEKLISLLSHAPWSVHEGQECNDNCLLLISGLDIGSKTSNPLSLQLLVDFITGQIGIRTTQSALSRVVRVIIAGNSLAKETRDRENATRAKYLMKKTSVASKDALTTLDELLIQLAASVDVDLMPGEFDPTTFTLPQQPFHKCLLPLSQRYPTLHRVPNPYQCVLDGLTIVGTSGQPVQDMYRSTTLTSQLDILENTLTYGHLAPTAPDTLACYPYPDTDPFILDSNPHIYFSGNAPEFGSRLMRRVMGHTETTLIVTVPRFSVTHSCVTINLKTFECQEVVVDLSSLECTQNGENMEVDS